MANDRNNLQRWALRVGRAQELRGEIPAMASALRLYEAILEFQSAIFHTRQEVVRAGVPLREQIEVAAAVCDMPALLALSGKHGPQPLGAAAEGLQRAGVDRWRGLLEAAVAANPPVEGFDDFFARSLLQPFAEHLQLQIENDRNYTQSRCPACGGLPQMAVLRPEGEGASRSLLCSFCLDEWLFRRLMCPWCGEESKEKLPRYSPEGCDYVHVEACETCKRYLKAVDVSVNGLAVPLVDEAAFAVLDVWATEHGYAKIAPNLLGF